MLESIFFSVVSEKENNNKSIFLNRLWKLIIHWGLKTLDLPFQIYKVINILAQVLNKNDKLVICVSTMHPKNEILAIPKAAYCALPNCFPSFSPEITTMNLYLPFSIPLCLLHRLFYPICYLLMCIFCFTNWVIHLHILQSQYFSFIVKYFEYFTHVHALTVWIYSQNVCVGKSSLQQCWHMFINK